MRQPGFGIKPDSKLHMLRCRACGVFMGWILQQRVAFCGDVKCHTVREWIWADDEDVKEMIVFLRDEWELPFREIGDLVGREERSVKSIYNNYRSRKSYTRM